MIRSIVGRSPRRLAGPFALFALSLLAACGGGSGDPDPCANPTCPPPPPTEGAVRLALDYAPGARGDLEPAGFRASEVQRVEVILTGPESQRLELPPNQTAAFLVLDGGQYTATATGFGDNNLTLFTATRTFTVALGDTVDVDLDMVAAIGVIGFTIGGESTGTVDAVAGTPVPFEIVVRNTAGQFVPNAAVDLRTVTPGFGTVVFTGGNATDLQGRVQGTIQAPRSGALQLTLAIDGVPVPGAGPSGVDFAVGVAQGNSGVESLTPPGELRPILADGAAIYTFTILVKNAAGDPLPDTPIVARSSRNGGIEPIVDVIEPAPGWESGLTDANGRFRFTVRTTTSSFLRLVAGGRLQSGDGSVFFPSTISVTADGLPIDQRDMTFTSTVNPSVVGGSSYSKAPEVAAANGVDFITLSVRAVRFGGAPAAGAYVEIRNALGQIVNETLDIQPAPGFTGFRTNAQGEWRGRVRSAVPLDMGTEAKVDGRVITQPLVILRFQ